MSAQSPELTSVFESFHGLLLTLPAALIHPDTFYTLTTGSSEKRWGRVKDLLQTTIRSFALVPRAA